MYMYKIILYVIPGPPQWSIMISTTLQNIPILSGELCIYSQRWTYLSNYYSQTTQIQCFCHPIPFTFLFLQLKKTLTARNVQHTISVWSFRSCHSKILIAQLPQTHGEFQDTALWEGYWNSDHQLTCILIRIECKFAACAYFFTRYDQFNGSNIICRINELSGSTLAPQCLALRDFRVEKDSGSQFSDIVILG